MNRFNNKQIETLSRHVSFKQCEIIAESYGYSVNTLYNVLRGNSKIKTTSRNKRVMADKRNHTLAQIEEAEEILAKVKLNMQRNNL